MNINILGLVGTALVVALMPIIYTPLFWAIILTYTVVASWQISK